MSDKSLYFKLLFHRLLVEPGNYFWWVPIDGVKYLLREDGRPVCWYRIVDGELIGDWP